MLTVRNVKKAFGTKEVLTDLSFEVPEGAIFGFIGQNGAGKTTTMKMILGLLRPDAGEIFVNGEKVTYGQNATNRYIGYLPDVPEFYGYMRPAEYLRMCGEITGMGREETCERTKELLQLVGLADEKRRISGFSRGMKQRLGIAQALLHHPKLLILDEPTSALDPVGRKEILDLLLKVRSHTTIVFSTHILSDVERICDRIAVLHEGMVVLQGTLEEIREAHKRHCIEIEFSSVSEKERFLEDEGMKAIIKDSLGQPEETSEADVLILHTEEVYLLQQRLYKVCLNGKFHPKRIDLGERTVESLFMEVVKP